MLARVPFAFTLDLDAGAVDQQVQRALRATIRNVDRKRPLASADGAEVRHGPIESRQPQEAFHKASRLAKRHPEQDFHREARLDCGVAEGPRSAPLAGGFGIPVHLGIEPTSHTCKHVLPVNGSSVTRGASKPHCRQPSSWFCRSAMSVCSCREATTLDSRHESLTRFVQQSRCEGGSLFTTNVVILSPLRASSREELQEHL
jgi:hypothetical protein